MVPTLTESFNDIEHAYGGGHTNSNQLAADGNNGRPLSNNSRISKKSVRGGGAGPQMNYRQAMEAHLL